MTNYEIALEYLKITAQRGSKLGLERIRQITELIDNPQDKTKIIHISGTNGKGSFGAMLTQILEAAGYRTGGFSSPAITEVTDSFRIGGNEVSQEKLGELICRIGPVCERLINKPTEFEVLTAAAFQLFAENKCDVALVECGMGGDLDSTNVISSPLLSVITNVRKDHCAFLGNTTEEIASHKSGIIKAGCPVLFGGSDSAAENVIISAAENSGSELFRTDYSRISDVSHSLEGTDFTFGGFGRLHINLAGTYQVYNAANVLTAVEILRRYGFTITDENVRTGLEKARWHGRFEILRKNPTVIFDGSHNPDGISSAAESIRLCLNGKAALLIGVMADKEYSLYADMLGDFTAHAFAVTPDNPRALDSKTLAETFAEKDIPATAFDSLEDGVKSAYEFAKKHNVPLIALGSLYMYREFINALDNLN